MIRMQKRGTRGQLLLYGLIGPEVSTTDVVRQLEEMRDVEQIDIWIASDGGRVLDGFTIYNALLRHPAKKVVWIDFALSVSSVIAMAGDERHIAKNGWLMVHNSWLSQITGDHQDLRRHADQLEAFTNQAATAYGRHVRGLSTSDLLALMDTETWIDADTALAQGWVTHIDDLEAAAAAFDLSRYEHVPAAALALIARQENAMPEPRPTPAPTPADPTPPPADPTPAAAPTAAQLAADRAALAAERTQLQAELTGLRADRTAARLERAEARVDRDIEALGTRITPAMLRTLRPTLVALAAAEQPTMVKVPKPGATAGETVEVSTYDAQLAALRELPENPALTAGELALADDPDAVFGAGRSSEVIALHRRHGLTDERMAELRNKYGPM